MNVFTHQEAVFELGTMYEPAEVAEILRTADACGLFADQIAWQGANYHVSVRAHQLSVNAPISYTIVVRP